MEEIRIKDLIRKKLKRKAKKTYVVLNYHFKKISGGEEFVDLLMENPKEFYRVFRQVFKSSEEVTDYLLSIILGILQPNYNNVYLKSIVNGIKRGDKELINRFLLFSDSK